MGSSCVHLAGGIYRAWVYQLRLHDLQCQMLCLHVNLYKNHTNIDVYSHQNEFSLLIIKLWLFLTETGEAK